MKNSSYLLLIVAILLSACTKDNNKSDLIASNENSNTKQANMRILDSFWYCCPPRFIITGCCWPAWNCLPDVVVTANSDNLTMFEDFESAYNEDEIADFFSDKSNAALFQGLIDLDSVLTDLQNGDITLYKRVGQDSLDYYIGLNTGAVLDSTFEDDLRVVFPVDDDR